VKALEQLLTYRSHINDFAGPWVDDSLGGSDSLEDGLRRLVIPSEAAEEAITECSLVDSCATEELCLVSAEDCPGKCQNAGAVVREESSMRPDPLYLSSETESASCRYGNPRASSQPKQ
jgi:hypothetical protein